MCWLNTGLDLLLVRDSLLLIPTCCTQAMARQKEASNSAGHERGWEGRL